MKKLIARGAESKLFLEKKIAIKNRFRKTYRLKEIDEKLRKFRTKREAKVLEKLQKINFPSPKPIKNNGKDILEMEFIDGKLIKNILEKSNYVKLSKEIGGKIAILHNNNIIHHDLTTSNMILDKEIYFIDFGLSFFSHKIEDKAVDLHLLKEGLESKHSEIWEKCYKAVLESYKNKAKDGNNILKRLKTVESRGRYKGRK
ncbi:MAG TPA: KEOPS complex kinase/ATPase Bud32 [Candidatus Woesearchaeota archaeon]|jgi:TP53 regulating kinase-like protein|nr:KEOPS complex kinase/ATPase Bud32 [Candidatus Woesearchaeota archaeon]|tara:strand:+ start:19209 stop:19811 length:603 start_codon:yes stop_codon:yes gene_type:complete